MIFLLTLSCYTTSLLMSNAFSNSKLTKAYNFDLSFFLSVSIFWFFYEIVVLFMVCLSFCRMLSANLNLAYIFGSLCFICHLYLSLSFSVSLFVSPSLPLSRERKREQESLIKIYQILIRVYRILICKYPTIFFAGYQIYSRKVNIEFLF